MSLLRRLLRHLTWRPVPIDLETRPLERHGGRIESLKVGGVEYLIYDEVAPFPLLTPTGSEPSWPEMRFLPPPPPPPLRGWQTFEILPAPAPDRRYSAIENQYTRAIGAKNGTP